MQTFKSSRRRFIGSVAAAIVALSVGRVDAEALDADAIVARSLRAFYYAGRDMRSHVTMRLVAEGGAARQREFAMLRRNLEGGRQQFYTYFESPPDVRAMTFLVHKHPERDDDRWIFIPAIEQVKRIAARDKRTSFVGSDFSYEDISGRELGDEKNRLVGEEVLGDRACYVVEGTPTAAAGHARRRAWIDKEHFLPLKEEYLDAAGKVLRTFTADEITRQGELWTITRATMKDARTRHRTEVILRDVRYDLGLDDSAFSELALRSPPRRWFQP
jgi:outer membrane lipoprotein-sorting protein